MNRPIYYACTAAALLMVAGCKKSEPMVAIVNGEPIPMADFHKYIELKPTVQVIVNPAQLQASTTGQLPTQPYNGQVVGSVALQAINDLVQQALLRQMAKDEGVWPTDAEVDAELKDRQKQSPEFVKALTSAGFTPQMITKDIAMQVAQFKLVTRGITVTDQEVDQYIKDHPTEFVAPESVELLWMLVPDDKTRKAADADLKAGQSFIVVAQKYATQPNARANQYRFPDSLVPNLAKYGKELLPAVQKTDEQQQTPWIKFTEGWAKFFVNRKQAARKLTIDDDMKKRVRKALMQQRGAAGKDINKRVQDRLKTAKIEIMLDYLKDPWKRSMESLEGQGGPGGSGASGTTEAGNTPPPQATSGGTTGK